MTWDACKGKSSLPKTLDEKADEAFEKYEPEDDFFEDDLNGGNNDKYNNTESTDYSLENEDSYSSENYLPTEDKVASTSTSSISASYKITTVRHGKYLLIAGNFLVKENAIAMVNKLLEMGYNEAEWAVFDYSQYYTVVAVRNDNYALAQSNSKELKSRGIDNYIHTKK